MPLPNARVFTSVADTIFPGVSEIARAIDQRVPLDISEVGDAHIDAWDSGIAQCITWCDEFVLSAAPLGFTALESLDANSLDLDYIAATFNAIPPTAFYLPPSGAFPTTTLDWWQDQQQALLQAAVTAWTPGGTVVQLGWDLELFVNGAVGVYTGRLAIQGGDDDLIVKRRLGAWISNAGKSTLPTLELTGVSLGSNTPPKPGRQLGGSYLDISRVIEPLKELAQKRIDISINNGAAMFSVNGGTRSEG